MICFLYFYWNRILPQIFFSGKSIGKNEIPASSGKAPWHEMIISAYCNTSLAQGIVFDAKNRNSLSDWGLNVGCKYLYYSTFPYATNQQSHLQFANRILRHTFLLSIKMLRAILVLTITSFDFIANSNYGPCL